MTLTTEITPAGRMHKHTRMDDGSIALRAVDTHALASSDPAEVVAFLKRAGTTGGFSITYAVNPTTGDVVEVFKRGKPVQRDVKPLIANGFTEWHFSWCWCCKEWVVNGKPTTVRVLDLTKWEDIAPWARAFGYNT